MCVCVYVCVCVCVFACASMLTGKQVQQVWLSAPTIAYKMLLETFATVTREIEKCVQAVKPHLHSS
jgi:hypothetical protein